METAFSGEYQVAVSSNGSFEFLPICDASLSLQVHGLSLVADFEGVSLFQVVMASTTEFARSSTAFDLIQVSAFGPFLSYRLQ